MEDLEGGWDSLGLAEYIDLCRIGTGIIGGCTYPLDL